MHHPFSDWTEVGERNRDISFDINSTPLQVYTDSEVGSGEMIWVQFHASNKGAGMGIYFNAQPKSFVGYCEEQEIPLGKLGTIKNRVWTIEKENTRVKLRCNGEQIFDFDTEDSTKDCKSHWVLDFITLKFADETITQDMADTASDFFRQYATGEATYMISILKW